MKDPSPELTPAALARLSHELKTPLVTIKGYAELLLDQTVQPLAPELRDWVRRIAAAANRLAALSRRMGLDARADALGAYQPRAVLPREWVERTVEEVLPLASTRRLAWSCEVPEGLPAVALDPDAGRELLLELLQNAARATPDGGRIRVVAAAEPRDGRAGVTVTVSDSGVGVPTGEAGEELFERFVVLGDLLGHQSGAFDFGASGLGLGLSMVRGVAAAHGGAAWTSGSGRDAGRLPGASVHVWLPAAGPELTETRATAAGLTPGKLLVLDADAEGREILERALAGAYEVCGAETAQAALSRWRAERGWAGCVFDPASLGGSACDFVDALRAHAGSRGAAVVCYAAGDVSEVEALRRAGVDAFLPKPLRARSIIRRIEEIRSRGGRP